MRESLGDRAFTFVEVAYGTAEPLRPHSMKRRGTCCLMEWNASITPNDDGSLDIESQQCCWGDPRGLDVTKESRPHFVDRSNQPVLVGSFVLVPWLFVEKHALGFFNIAFFPLAEQSYALDDAGARPHPDGVPRTDRGIALKPSPYGAAVSWIWYDPCTYVVDAFEYPNGGVNLRDHPAPEGHLNF